jgi:hypothetical protein
MAVTQTRSGVQLPLRPRDADSPDVTMETAESPVALRGIVWWDVRDHVWRGLVTAFSLFAEADTREEVIAQLTEKVATYIQDVREQGLEADLIPRPLPTRERRKLEWFLRALQVRAWLARTVFLAPRIPTPVVQRVPVTWRG